MEIRRALRAYRRGRPAQPVPIGQVIPGPAPEKKVLLNEVDDSVLDRVVGTEEKAEPDKDEMAKRNLERLKEMF